jgi:hypothetical protein
LYTSFGIPSSDDFDKPAATLFVDTLVSAEALSGYCVIGAHLDGSFEVSSQKFEIPSCPP